MLQQHKERCNCHKTLTTVSRLSLPCESCQRDYSLYQLTLKTIYTASRCSLEAVCSRTSCYVSKTWSKDSIFSMPARCQLSYCMHASTCTCITSTCWMLCSNLFGQLMIASTSLFVDCFHQHFPCGWTVLLHIILSIEP